MGEFTKGPWIVLYDLNNRPVAIEAPHDMTIPGAVGHIVRTNGIGLPSSPVAFANALLIAAAPDMYEAMKALERLWGLGCSSDKFVQYLRDEVMDGIRSAIAKAEGR